MKYFLVFICVLFFTGLVQGQDTFYVKKKQPVQVANNSPRPVWTADNKDSIVSYTVEFQKPGTNVYVVLHEKGPGLNTPIGAYGPNGLVRLVYTDIIAIDSSGRRYRQPDLVKYNGVTVPLKVK